jgi:hypothetical protein
MSKRKRGLMGAPSATWLTHVSIPSVFTAPTPAPTPAPVPKKTKGKQTTAAAEYVPCGLETRAQEENELGTPDARCGCFGCVYVGEQDSAELPYEDIMALLNMMRRSIARSDPINLSIHVAERYDQLRTEVNRNLMPGEEPLPEWTAATILDHIRNHNTDPEIQLWIRLTEMQELAQVALHASVQRNAETGEKHINEKQCKIYLELVKQIESLQKSDPSKKVFYSGGQHIDYKVASQGFLAMSGKPVVSYWNSARSNHE